MTIPKYLSDEAYEKCLNLLKSQEGFRQFPYKDTTGNTTIGYGRNLDVRGVFQDEAGMMLNNDIPYFTSRLYFKLPLFKNSSDEVKIVLISMCVNLGINGLLEFTTFLNFLQSGDFKNASIDLLNTKAAEQAPARYKQLAEMLYSGDY
jgi:lysozyme